MEECNGKVISFRRRMRPKRLEFVGWGSRQLIEFLESLGIDTTSKISEYEVTTILGKYFQEKNLLHPLKKKKRKRIVCDERLLSLFGSKTISRNKVHDLIAKHYVENQDDPYFDFLYGTENEQQVCFQSDLKVNKTRQVVEKPKAKGIFAAILSDNIKLLYLRRSLVQELVKVPDTFEGKMVGTFVRIKSDPNDYLQKNLYLLVQVTGVKDEHSPDGYLLQVTNYLKDVPVSVLSDDDFSQEECEDLRQRIKNGFVKRPTVVEMEEKAQSLHEDMTKHWLARELVLLQRLIDQANEKGWRRELSEYLERRELLKNPEELSRLLGEVPEVIGEELESECIQDPELDCVEEPELDCVEEPEPEPECVEEPEPDSVELEPDCVEEPEPDCAEEIEPDCVDDDGKMEDFIAPIPLASSKAHQSDKEQHLSDSPIPSLQETPELPKFHDGEEHKSTGFLLSSLRSAPEIISPDMTVNRMLPTSTDYAGNKDLHKDVDEPPANNITKNNSVTKLTQHQSNNPSSDLNNVSQTQPKPTEIIELSSDDDDDDEDDNYTEETHDSTQQYDLEKLKWFYEYPKGQTQGPFSITQLKQWNDDEYFTEIPDFKVWMTGQNMKAAVLLSRLLASYNIT